MGKGFFKDTCNCNITFLLTACATSGEGTAYHSGTPEFTQVFSEVRVDQCLVFCVVFCRSLFVLLCFFF